jgi:proline iminopeptidase
MKIFLLILGLVVVVIMAVVIMFVIKSSQPMYEVGNVTKGINISASFEPPAQPKGVDYFLVEEEIKLHYFTQGAGTNVLIIHGGPGMPNTSEWTGLNELSKDYQFIYYDQRGCGNSTRPIDTFASKNYHNNMLELESTLGLTAQIADIERIRRILGEDKLIIIGHSFGGFLATLYAAEFPDNVEKLILVAPAPLMKMPMETEDLFANIKKRLPDNELEGYEDFVKRYFDYQNIFNNSDKDLVNLNNELEYYFNLAYSATEYVPPENNMAGGWMIQAMNFSMGKKHDYTKSFPELDTEVLIIHPGADFVQTEAASKTYLDLFKNAEFVIIDDSGHAVFEDAPEIFGDTIKSFLNDYSEVLE